MTSYLLTVRISMPNKFSKIPLAHIREMPTTFSEKSVEWREKGCPCE